MSPPFEDLKSDHDDNHPHSSSQTHQHAGVHGASRRQLGDDPSNKSKIRSHSNDLSHQIENYRYLPQQQQSPCFASLSNSSFNANDATTHDEESAGHSELAVTEMVRCASDDSGHSASGLPLMMEDHENGDGHYYSGSSNSSVIDNNPRSDNSQTDVPSNETLLGTAFLSFMSFALMELIFAIIAGSEAMMGDAAAMIVDSITYLFNWMAERQKKRYDLERTESSIEMEPGGVNSDAETSRIHQRNRRKMVLQLEIIPPVISVTTLVIVTAFVTRKAVHVLQLDMHRSRSEQKRPNVGLMLAFSVFNLLLDGLNVFCFSKANHALGYATEEPDIDDADSTKAVELDGTSPSSAVATTHFLCKDGEQQNAVKAKLNALPQSSNQKIGYKHLKSSTEPFNDMEDDRPFTNGPEQHPDYNHNGSTGFDNNHHSHEHHHHQNKEHANLNMCSAYTHVFADTLRSIAVIIAAVLAEFLPAVTPEEADATAAVVVSGLILLSLLPLLQGLWRSVVELCAILAEERSERMITGAVDGLRIVNPLPQREFPTSSSFELT